MSIEAFSNSAGRYAARHIIDDLLQRGLQQFAGGLFAFSRRRATPTAWPSRAPARSSSTALPTALRDPDMLHLVREHRHILQGLHRGSRLRCGRAGSPRPNPTFARFSEAHHLAIGKLLAGDQEAGSGRVRDIRQTLSVEAGNAFWPIIPPSSARDL